MPTWINYLQLAMAILAQALQAFQTGAHKEDGAKFHLSDEHRATIEHLAQQ